MGEKTERRYIKTGNGEKVVRVQYDTNYSVCYCNVHYKETFSD